MPYNSGNFSFVIDSSFNPLTQEEMLRPLLQYKDAYEQSEAQYIDYANKANKFKYLSETLPENSEARKIYEGYANYFNEQAKDFNTNGLSIANRRGLNELRNRYAGEIGMLEEAEANRKKELERRMEMSAKDPSMIWASDNFGIDDYLYGRTPNLYGVSGDDIYKLGMETAKALSSREQREGDAGSYMNGYYNLFEQVKGMSNEELARFMQSDAALALADNILAQKNALQNLSGNNLAAARRAALNGIYNGVIYERDVKPIRNEDKMSAKERNDVALSWANYNLKKQGYEDERNATYEIDPITGQVTGLKPKASSSSRTGSGSSGGSTRYPVYDKQHMFGVNGGAVKETTGNVDEINKIKQNSLQIQLVEDPTTQERVVRATNGVNSFELGRMFMDDNHNWRFNLSSADEKKYKEFFGKSYNKDRGLLTENMLKDINTLLQKEGTDLNYSIWYNPKDNKYIIDPNSREMPTVFNNGFNNNGFDNGFGNNNDEENVGL